MQRGREQSSAACGAERAQKILVNEIDKTTFLRKPHHKRHCHRRRSKHCKHCRACRLRLAATLRHRPYEQDKGQKHRRDVVFHEQCAHKTHSKHEIRPPFPAQATHGTAQRIDDKGNERHREVLATCLVVHQETESGKHHRQHGDK